MCGFDLRIRHQDGRMEKDDPHRSQWGHFEAIFTNNYRYITNNDYRAFLFTYDSKDFGYKEEYKDEFYQRRWTKAILEYGTMYQEADVSMAPLKGGNHMFNYMKSQLKIVECGAHHMPIIASNYGPYTIDDIEGKIDKKPKGFVIEEKNNDWYTKMKWYADNPQAVKDHGENMYEYIKATYASEIINTKRAEFYKRVVLEPAKVAELVQLK